METDNEKCSICSKLIVEHKYYPMESWNINGVLCGTCYSQKISEFYPGTHERTRS
ncbi:MAG TPA: hypothetical protein HA319_05215 [Nitrosopumilaceae archaeon]|nr:hypothetical protein [Nitrosopumilaceae archaeon]